MITILKDLIQGTEEWKELRRGKITGTSAWKLLAGQSPQDIINESLQESNFLGNEFTDRGHTLEPEARKIYEEINQVAVTEAGAILNDEYPNCLASPDGLIGDNGGIEIKSFLPEHMQNVWKNLDSKIIAQVMWNLFLSERDFWDLVLFNPELPPEEAFKTKRFYPDEEIFNKFRTALLSTYDDACIEETAFTLVKLEQQLQAQEESLKSQLEIRDALNNQINELKQRLKEETTGKVSKKLSLGKDTLSLNIHDTIKIIVDNPSQVEDEFTIKQEITDAYEDGGKIYQKVPNPKLVQNLVKSGKSLPKGFKQKTSRSISIKFNGKTI